MSKDPKIKSPLLPDEFEELDFEIIDEYWNEYDLSDGVRINARTILKKVVRDPNNPTVYSFDLQPIVSTVYAPLANRGERQNPPQPNEWTTLPSYECKLTKADEKFNTYKILKTGQILRLKLIVHIIKRIKDRYDKDGLPFYLIESGPLVTIDKPMKLQQ